MPKVLSIILVDAIGHYVQIFQDDVLEIARNPSISTFKMDVYENRKMGSEKTGQHHSANPEHEQVFDSSMEEVPLFKLKVSSLSHQYVYHRQ